MTNKNAKTTTRPARKSAARDSSKKTLTWQTTEGTTRRRWWWYVLLGLLGFWLSGLAATTGNWPLAAVIAVATFALILTNAVRPRQWTVTLSPSRLIIDRPGHERFRREYSLDLFRAFTVVEGQPDKHGRLPQPYLMLVPTRRVRSGVFIYLSGEPARDAAVISKLGTYLPFDAATEASERGLDRLSRWLRIG